MEMDEKLKDRREMIFKVLAWGTFVYFLVWGYSLTQSDLFELQPAPPEEISLEKAKYDQATQLENAQGASDSETAKHKVEAAQIRMDVNLAREVRNDRWWRAIGLITGALIYCLIYPAVVWSVYKRTEPDADAPYKDLIPLRGALIYAIVMSVSTFTTAFLTAYR